MPNDSALTAAVEKAVATQDRQDMSRVDLNPPPREVPEEENEEIEEPEGVAQPALDEDAIQGRSLIQALRNPESAAIVIDMLARQAGYSKIESKGEAREAKSDITAALETELGDEFKFIAPKIGKVIQQYLDDRLENLPDANGDLRQRLDNTELSLIQGETSRTHAAISQEYFGKNDMPADVKRAMEAAIDDFPPSPTMSPETYYRKIFAMVAGEMGITNTSSRSRDRIIANRREEPANQLSRRTSGLRPSEGGGEKKMKLNDAVQLAMRQVEAAQNRR